LISPKPPVSQARRPQKPLSPRQQGVLQLIALGLSNKQIARELGIAPETVKSHAKKILAKFHAKTRAAAVAHAARFRIGMDGMHAISERG